MERHSLLLVLSGLIVVYWAAQVPSQYFEDPTQFYKNMTFDYDVRHRGGVGMPTCVKQLMACWDVMRPEIMCSHLSFYETACGVMHFKRCHEIATFGELGWAYENFHMFEQFCTPMDYWT